MKKLFKEEEPAKDKEPQILSPNAVSRQATGIALDTIGFYSKNNQFMIRDNRVDGNGVVEVSISWESIITTEKSYYVPFQTMEFSDGVLIDARGGDSWYEYNPDENTIKCGNNMTASDNARWHMVNVVISPNEQRLEEVTRVQTHTDLGAVYRPDQNEGDTGFQLECVNLNQHLPLEPTDINKFLPNGRFIPLAHLLYSTIHPYMSNQENRERVPEISKASGFPEFDRAGDRAHSTLYVTTLDHNYDAMLGFAHPLKNNPDGWLVFVRFGTGEKSIGRALLVEIDRESVQVENYGGVPTIVAQASVDGEIFDLSIPKQRELDEVTRSVQDGYYVDDMLDTVLTVFYEKYYKETAKAE